MYPKCDLIHVWRATAQDLLSLLQSISYLLRKLFSPDAIGHQPVALCSGFLVMLMMLNGWGGLGEERRAIALTYDVSPVLIELTPEAKDYTTPSVTPDPDQALDLERAAQRAEEASEKIYRGLDQTKRSIGKTELRKQAIEHGRDHASRKWDALAEKARRAQRGEATLSPVDRFNLWRLQRRTQE